MIWWVISATDNIFSPAKGSVQAYPWLCWHRRCQLPTQAVGTRKIDESLVVSTTLSSAGEGTTRASLRRRRITAYPDPDSSFWRSCVRLSWLIKHSACSLCCIANAADIMVASPRWSQKQFSRTTGRYGLSRNLEAPPMVLPANQHSEEKLQKQFLPHPIGACRDWCQRFLIRLSYRIGRKHVQGFFS